MILRIKNLCKEYKRNNLSFMAVNNVNLEIEEGDFVNIIGRSGSGKSTLLNIAAGMLSPSSGVVEFNGETLTGKSDYELSRIRNDKIGFIPQGASALGNLTVMENIVLPFYLWPHGGDAEGHARILLERFEISNLAESYPSELSGGELRRVLIARALINDPKIIIADEPTADLDSKSSENIMKTFAKLNQDENITLLIVSHDLDTLKYGKRILEMNDGKLFSKSSAIQ